MRCTKPILITVSRKTGLSPENVPCGRCINCRLEKKRNWAIRMLHELQVNDFIGCFVTLTYNNDNLPENGTLVKKDVQLFMKRLRKLYPPKTLRYFLVGEYGDSFDRPHYHVAFFGVDFTDKKDRLNLDSSWTYGHTHVGTLTWDSMSYVAGYITKKLTGPLSVHYKKNNIIPEFSLMSRRPGIGETWRLKYLDKDSEFIYINGKKSMLPKFYDRKFNELKKFIDNFGIKRVIKDEERIEKNKLKKLQRILEDAKIQNERAVENDMLLHKWKEQVNKQVEKNSLAMHNMRKRG